MPLNLLEEEQAEKLKRMGRWRYIQTRERTAMRSVQVSTIHTISIVISEQDITYLGYIVLVVFRDSRKSTLNLW
jgi:hypothetical protein